MESSSKSNERLVILFRRAPESDLQELYERHEVAAADGVEALVDEIRRDGSNTLITYSFRSGEGVNYDEIVKGVADTVGVKYDPTQITDEAQLELAVAQHLIRKYFDSLTPEQRASFQEHLDSLGEKYSDFWRQFLEADAMAILALVQVLGSEVVARLLAQVIGRLIVIRGGTLIAGRLVGLVIPFLNVALAVWLAIDIAGPAYRKTVPTVFQIALLRLQYGE